MRRRSRSSPPGATVTSTAELPCSATPTVAARCVRRLATSYTFGERAVGCADLPSGHRFQTGARASQPTGDLPAGVGHSLGARVAGMFQFPNRRVGIAKSTLGQGDVLHHVVPRPIGSGWNRSSSKACRVAPLFDPPLAYHIRVEKPRKMHGAPPPLGQDPLSL